ncbi:galactose-1-phosphate uridylyltransferase [Fervidobacterium pennivorans subsp. shakshaketiis]|jgi:UDPglucose--hexose-1-phosphate uridylyltransferase|uniref:Galactose-1-phosphate uridylyltransferase n=1 Tax=Fervidobacterium pennivorans (strain DSM 9078 / Ven5) TaxID=771875 RepID=H9UBR8_FERPD|nr:galactose-1-phosphate uridylyltransferase [Fervidobacterium pennivorans]AFG34961.1 galactose-1-phosphate uridylyltransferase, family 1 [Fervidobacterium pennivorans DSM 9078]QIV78141.1 galactose-1-phosphate uridylyltransferase [Fervidobacterium pennivorans subsp. keratinolyticus]
MMERRWNLLTGEWVMVSAYTQARPTNPTNFCPLCPGGDEFETEYDLVSFDNRYPSMKIDAPEVQSTGIYRKARSNGKCEVVVYTIEHESAMSMMPIHQIEKLIQMWVDRYLDLSQNRFIKYVFIFENRGKEVGATLPHPHGQLYAFPFIPKRIEAKLQALSQYYDENGSCAVCDIVDNEIKLKERIIYENESFITLVPFYARWPYEVHVYPKRHVSTLVELTNTERYHLAKALKVVTMKYDLLFKQAFPYMMMLFQAPVNDVSYSHAFHFHIEFNPVKRDKDKIKWMASVETGTWAFINPKIPEEAAKELRNVEVEL